MYEKGVLCVKKKEYRIVGFGKEELRKAAASSRNRADGSAVGFVALRLKEITMAGFKHDEIC